MNEEFKKWFAEYYGEDCNNQQKGAARDGWNACKRKVMETIINNSTIPGVVPVPEFYPLESIVKKIKEL